MIPTETERSAPKLSVVIIGRNEEQFIGQSIRSALAATADLPGGAEVIFADSASTDRSVEIAAQLPVRVLQLRPEWPLCVAAGRYTGYLHSTGDYVFFMDGDSVVQQDWLAQAVDFLDRNPEYGAVAGVLDEEYIDPAGGRMGGRKNIRGQDLSAERIDCKTLGGIAMFRRAALDQAGTVNPHLPTAEDHELCMRIRNAGYKLARIPGLMSIKYTERRDTLGEVLRRTRTRMYDYGAVIRYSALYGGGWQFCFDAIPYVVSFAATVLLFLLALPLAIYFHQLWLLGLAGLLVCLAVVIRKGSIRGAVMSLLIRSVTTLRTIISFVRTKPQPIDAYPTDVIQIR